MSNLQKHGLDFGDAVLAFSDVNRLIVEDRRADYGETRWNMLALLGVRLVHVTFTKRADVIWLISARKANDREAKRYESSP